MSSCLERLGRPADARLVLIVADSLGASNASNLGVFRALREGVATSAGALTRGETVLSRIRLTSERYPGQNAGVWIG